MGKSTIVKLFSAVEVMADERYRIIKARGGDPEKETGTLIYLKTTLTGGLPADIYGYQAGHPEFPDEPTSDQFFDEAQFEAYRELGYQLCTQMLGDEPVLAALECGGRK